MRERVPHRHYRITGRIAACLPVMLPVMLAGVMAGVIAGAILPGEAAQAEDQAVNQTGSQAGNQAGNQTGHQTVNQTLDRTRDRTSGRTGSQAGDHANQLFILGQNRESGDWVRPNLVQAYMWYLLAMTAGHGQAAEERARIATGMTADQITAAWSRAGRCLVSGYLYCDEWAEP